MTSCVVYADSRVFTGNTKGGSITVPLTSCLTSLDQSVLQMKTKIVISHTADSKPVKQEVNGTVILPPLVFPGFYIVMQSVLMLRNVILSVAIMSVVLLCIVAPKVGPLQLQKWLDVCCAFAVHNNKTAKLRVENSAQTTSRLSPIEYHAPCLLLLMEEHDLKNLNNNLNTNIYSYLEKSVACIINM